MTPLEARRAMAHLTADERAELERLIAEDAAKVIWRPLPGPQTMAYESQADVIGFGGAAGGGKTDLAIGKALTQAHEVMIMRREATQLQGILQRLRALLGSDAGYNGQDKIWRRCGPRGVLVEFGSCPNLGDEKRQQGRPHDLLVFDEATNFLEAQVRFLLGWNRSTRDGAHSQTLMMFNPPTDSEGRWVVDFFAPWLDRKHPLYPTPPGALRYVVMVPTDSGVSRDMWVERADPCVIVNGELVYEFDPDRFAPEDILHPQSRTFIPSRISDNPFLLNSGYLTQLQAFPEPLRSQMLYGDFQAGMQDDPWQVIPTAWVDAAQARWRPLSPRGEQMALGVDVARGGKDRTVIAARYRPPDGGGPWYDTLRLHPGSETPDGPRTASLVIAERRDDAPVAVDVIGVGASPFDFLQAAQVHVIGVNVAEAATTTDRSGRLRFFNLRSQLWWQFREALDPANDVGLALPPDPELAKELCAPRWTLSGFTVKVESRDDIVERIGRSPDRATAVILAWPDMPKRPRRRGHAGAGAGATHKPGAGRDYDPFAHM